MRLGERKSYGALEGLVKVVQQVLRRARKDAVAAGKMKSILLGQRAVKPLRLQARGI